MNRSTKTRVRIAGVALALFIGAGAAGANETGRGAAGGDDVFDPTVIERLGDAVADWQLAHLDDLGYIRNLREGDLDRRGWQHGAFYIGLMRWSGLPGKERYLEALQRIAEDNEWRLGERLFHGDDHLVGQLYLYLYALEKDDGKLDHTIRQFNQVLAVSPDTPLEFAGEHIHGVGRACQVRWCWCDALFMAPATWIGLSLATGDDRYLEFGDREFRAIRDYLADPETHLFYRDSRYFDRRDEEGNKVFWSRGNGWVYAGVVNILRTLPRDHSSWPYYLDLYREMSATVASLQNDNGLWRVSLLAREKYETPETSGSAFMTYGLAWGVNEGHLEAARYGPVVRKGWAALAVAVDSEGKLGWVQPVGYAPDSVLASDSHLFGVGAFLLAAEQMYRAGN